MAEIGEEEIYESSRMKHLEQQIQRAYCDQGRDGPLASIARLFIGKERELEAARTALSASEARVKALDEAAGVAATQAKRQETLHDRSKNCGDRAGQEQASRGHATAKVIESDILALKEKQ